VSLGQACRIALTVSLQLHSYANGNPSLTARVSKVHNQVTLEISTEALRIGLLEVLLTATLLLQCGRNID